VTPKMSLAPVFYTLAQVQFNPITQMTKYVSPLQERLRRNGFPDYRADSQIEFAMRRLDESQPDVQQQQHVRWSFTNSERTEGYQLTGSTLVFHTTIYDTFQDFLKKTILGLELVHEFVGLAYTERIGLRYLDAIVPMGDDILQQYLNSSLLGLSDNIDGQLAHSFTETVKFIENGTLVTRAVITDNVLSLSPDLFPLQLELAPRFKEINSRHAVLDTDYFVTQRTNFDVAEIRNKLLFAHDVVTNAFDCSVTEYSKQKWA
jgi:uncharacterized protein (TIGR04255 family)